MAMMFFQSVIPEFSQQKSNLTFWILVPQVAQARNISIGEHRRCCVTLISKYKDLYGKEPTVSVTYENERISIKNSLPYIKCVLRLSWVVHAPFYGLYSKRASLHIKVYQGWGLQRSGPTDPPKENGRKFAPMAPVASKFRLGNRR